MIWMSFAALAAMAQSGMQNRCAVALEELTALNVAASDTSVTEAQRMERLAALQERIAALEAMGVDVSAVAPRAELRAGSDENPSAATGIARQKDRLMLDAVAGRSLQGAFLWTALEHGHIALAQALERSFAESFDFVSIPPRASEGIRGFEMQVTPVTQAQFALWRFIAGMTDPGSFFRFGGVEFADEDHAVLGNGITINYNHPAENMAKTHADAFITWLNSLEIVRMSGCRYDLPSKYEWAHAARVSTGNPRNYDDDRPFPDVELSEYAAHSRDKKIQGTMSVARLRALPNGLRHMFGNVSELTRTISAGGSANPLYHACGGDAFAGLHHLKSGASQTVWGDIRHEDVGFRLIRICSPR